VLFGGRSDRSPPCDFFRLRHYNALIMIDAHDSRTGRAQPAAAGKPQRRRWQTMDRVLIALVAALAVLVLVVAVLTAVTAVLFHSDLILPGISVQGLGVDLGGKTTAEAASLLRQQWQARAIRLEGGEVGWDVTPAMLGLLIDVDATVKGAYQQGRTLGSLSAWLAGGRRSRVPMAWAYDATVAESNLMSLAPQLALPPTDASVRFEGGRVQPVPATYGQQLDVAATLNALSANPAQVVSQGRLDLVMVPVAPAITDVTAYVQQAERLLATTVVIDGYDPITDQRQQWLLKPTIWGQWLSLTFDPQAPTELKWSLDEQGLRSYIEQQVAASLGPERYLDQNVLAQDVTAAVADVPPSGTETPQRVVKTRIYHHDRQHVVRLGETLSSIAFDYGIPYPWIQQANPDAESLSVGQTLTIPSPDVMLPLPVVENKRIIVSLSEQRVQAYENGTLKWDWSASTGIDSSPTSPGIFQVQTHEENAYAANWNLWMPYFVGIYRPVPTADFMNGFHGFPTRGGATLLWTGDLGHRVTYGCILVSTENAIALFDWAEDGVVVEIVR
jgi:LysM repeat protein